MLTVAEAGVLGASIVEAHPPMSNAAKPARAGLMSNFIRIRVGCVFMVVGFSLGYVLLLCLLSPVCFSVGYSFAAHCFSGGKIVFQSSFMLTTVQPFAEA